MNTATISGNDFLDILFNGRNKDYGAYELRRKYDQRVRNAIFGTASVALVVIGGYALSNQLSSSVTATRNVPVVDVTRLETLPPPETKTPPPPALPSSNPAPVKPTVKYVQPLIVSNNEVTAEDVPPRMDEMVNKAVGVSAAAGDEDGIDPGLQLAGTGTGVIEVTAPAEREDRDKVFTFVEVMPSFPGGEAALITYLTKNTHYPSLAAENEIYGKVVVQFVVDYEGNVKDVKIISERRGGGLEEEAARVVKAMPKWKPGRQNGNNVSVFFTLPINFTPNR